MSFFAIYLPYCFGTRKYDELPKGVQDMRIFAVKFQTQSYDPEYGNKRRNSM